MAITSANLANAMVKLVAVDALSALCGDLVMGNLVTRDFEPSLAQSGDVANVLTAGAGFVPIALSAAEETFQIPDVTKVIAVPDLLRLYMQPAISRLAEKIESDLLALYGQFTANALSGTGGAGLTEAVIDAAETSLWEAKTPTWEPKILVVDGRGYSQLRKIRCFSEYQTASDAGLRALVNGSVGRIKDLFVLRSQFVHKSGSDPVTTHNLAFTIDAIGLATRRMAQPLAGSGTIAEYSEYGNLGLRVAMDYRPNTLSQQFAVGILYGVGVLRNDFGVQVLS